MWSYGPTLNKPAVLEYRWRTNDECGLNHLLTWHVGTALCQTNGSFPLEHDKDKPNCGICREEREQRRRDDGRERGLPGR